MNQSIVASHLSPITTHADDQFGVQRENISERFVESRSGRVHSGIEAFFHALPDIAPNKKPATGAVIGLVFGLLGLSIYLRSWFDFLLFIAAIGIFVVAPPDIPMWVPWLLWGVWGYLRVKHSRVRPVKHTVRVSNTALSDVS